MSWPVTPNASSAAVLAWADLRAQIVALRQWSQTRRALIAQPGARFDLRILREWGRTLRTALTLLNAQVPVPGLQAHIRQWSGDAAFDLAAEVAALRAVLEAALTELRAAYLTAAGGIAVDGTVSDPGDSVGGADLAAFVSALTALEAQIV